MNPPPVTPSPHRFMIKKPQRAPPPAVPHREQQQREPIQQESQTKQTRRQQFNEAPRFSFATSQRSPAVSPVVRSHVVNTVPCVRPGTRLEDVIDDVRDEENENALLNAENCYQVREPNEESDPNRHLEPEPLYAPAGIETDYDFPARDPKRRRLSSLSFVETEDDQGEGHDLDVDVEMVETVHANISEQLQDPDHEFEDLLSSGNTAISSPRQFSTPRQLQNQPSTAGPSNAHRFRFVSTPRSAPHANPQAFTEHQNTPFTKPPRFRPPAEEEQTGGAPGEPLPDAFSPQRRGQKFLPGGLASEVVGWVMNLESNTTEMGPSMGPSEEKWAVRILIEEVRGGDPAMTLVRGRSIKNRNDPEDDPRQNVILAGVGAPDAFRGQGKVEMGKMVGIKGPVWEVMVDGQKWGVAVTWMVLD